MSNIDTQILNTHYGVVRYLYYEILLKRDNKINDLQSQMIFLSSINKYLLCRTGQYSHLYQLYSKLTSDQIHDYYKLQQIIMNRNRDTWLDYSRILSAPEIIPANVNGPYACHNINLKTYSYFWSQSRYNIRSDILATPFFCLYGIDHLYYEMITWRTQCENFDKLININISAKHVFHDIFYIVDITSTSQNTQAIDIRFLIWLDDASMESELSLNNNENHNSNTCLLKRLYIACDKPSFIYELSSVDAKSQRLIILNMLMNNLSQNFISTFDGCVPTITNFTSLDITNSDGNLSSSSSLDFSRISRNGFNININDQIYTIENLSQLRTAHISTPNFLLLQETIYISSAPTLTTMNNRLQILLNFLSRGIIDNKIYIRMYMLPRVFNSVPKSMYKQLNIIYTQKYIRFDINRSQSPNFDTTFFDKIYVFSARNLTCTIKSNKYLIRDVIKSTPLLPPCVVVVEKINNSNPRWFRVTQNIIYLQQLKTLCFLKNFTLQIIDSNIDDDDDSFIKDFNNDNEYDIKECTIVNDKFIRDEIYEIFSHIDLHSFEITTIFTFQDIDFKRITINANLNLELYYFAKDINNFDFDRPMKQYIYQLLRNVDIQQKLNDKIYTILLHLHNLYKNDFLL